MITKLFTPMKVGNCTIPNGIDRVKNFTEEKWNDYY